MDLLTLEELSIQSRVFLKANITTYYLEKWKCIQKGKNYCHSEKRESSQGNV